MLGRDFGYRKFYRYPNEHDCWISTTDGEPDHPHFGDVAEIYNVIDARQAEAQNTVVEALRGLGYNQQADHYTHFSYEMVALTPRCAAELGYQLSDEDKTRSYIEVSGRKGFGVKADDLIDTLIASAKKEVDPRHPQLSEAERMTIATQIAVGALRYFMLKFTKPSVIAFDFKEALSFEGETGPYAQYAVVRASNIFRKGGLDPDIFARDVASYVSTDDFAKISEERRRKRDLGAVAGVLEDVLRDRSVHRNYRTSVLGEARVPVGTTFQRFLSPLSRFSLSRMKSRKKFLFATIAVVRRELIRALAVMGITVPSAM